MNYHALIGFIIAILMFSAIAQTIGKLLRNRPWTSLGIGFVLYFVIFSLCIGILPTASTALFCFMAHLVSLSIVIPIIIGLKDKRPRCKQCGSVLNPEAKICHACHTALCEKPNPSKNRTSVPRNTVRTVACPSCGKPIRESALKTGMNQCPHCNSKFECM